MSVSEKLPVLPLSMEENFFFQKCLLPESKFPAFARPGTWAKVTTSSKTSVCQLFPRNNGQHVFLDECVTIGITEERKDDLQDHVLDCVECLELSEAPAEEIQVTFVISDHLLKRKNLRKLNLTFLTDVAQILLQSFHLTSECTVRMPELVEAGILAMQVRVNKALPETIYCIDEYTSLIVQDVQLIGTTARGGRPTISKICRNGFETPRQELQDILYVARMQSQRKNNRFLLSLNALLVGDTGIGKSTLAECFIIENNCNCFRVMASDVLGQYPGETEAELRRIFQAAQAFQQQLKPQAPTVILLEDLHLLCPTQQSSRGSSGDASNALRTCTQLLALVDELHRIDSGIICLATTTSPQAINELARRPGRFEREIIIAPPTPEQRRQLFAALWNESYMAKETTNLNTELLDLIEKQTQGYVVADLALLVHSMDRVLLHNKDTSSAVIDALLKETIKKSQPTSIRGADVQVIRTSQDFNTLGGMEDLKRVLKISVLAALEKCEVFQRFGVSAPKGVLLYGPPGCAKTTIAKCLAAEANYNFICASGAEVYSPYVGCAEKFISKIFDTARRNAPCIIFLDEIDCLVGRRATGTSDVQIRILSTLLTEMDGIISATATHASVRDHILVVAATNRPDMIDDALLRPGRFDKLIHVPAPDYDSRLNILQLHQQRMPFGSDVDLCEIAERTVNFSGADLCSICNEAAIYAFQCNFNATEICTKDFDHVLLTQKSSLTQQQIEWFLNFERKYYK